MLSLEPDRTLLPCWAELQLPAQLNVSQASKVLGFGVHEIAILISFGMLKALGKPAPNAPKYLSAMEVLSLAADRHCLDKATRRMAEHWRDKRNGKKSEFGKVPESGTCLSHE